MKKPPPDAIIGGFLCAALLAGGFGVIYNTFIGHSHFLDLLSDYCRTIVKWTLYLFATLEISAHAIIFIIITAIIVMAIFITPLVYLIDWIRKLTTSHRR